MKLSIGRLLALLFAAFAVSIAIGMALFNQYVHSTNANTALLEAALTMRAHAAVLHSLAGRGDLAASELDYFKEILPNVRSAIESIEHGSSWYVPMLPAGSEFKARLKTLKRIWSELEPQLIRLAARSEDVSPPDRRWQPLLPDFQQEAHLLVQQIQGRFAGIRYRMYVLMALGFAVNCALVALAFVSLRRRVTRPIGLLRSGTEVLQSTSFAHRVPVLYPDELGDLTRSFNRMAGMIQQFLAEKQKSVEKLTRTNLDLEREIEERRQIERRMRDSEARLERAQRIASVGNWEVDLERRRLHWSDEVYRIFGIDRSQGPVTHPQFWEAVHPEDLAAVRQASEQALAGRTPYAMEHRIVRPDGSVRWVREQAEVICDVLGRPVEMVGTVQDITEQRNIEEQLHQSQKMEALGLMAGGVAHDFNNILTVINGYASLLHESFKEGPAVKKAVENIRTAGERAAALTHQLLAFSRKQVMQHTIHDVNRAVAGLKPMLARLLREDIELNVVLCQGAAWIKADPVQVEQVLVNLALNAADAMPDGGRLMIESGLVEFTRPEALEHAGLPPGRYVMLAVSDTGVGMTEEMQCRIFEPFFTTKPAGKGTGLGLSMAFGIVKQSAGHIWLYSEPGAGTTFKVFFPLCAGGTPAEPVVEIAVRTPRGSETILLAEDNEAVRGLAVDSLRGFGYRVLAAPGPEEAVRLSQEHVGDIHLLLSDVVMPRMNGVDLAERIKRERPAIRVLFVSGYADNAVTSHGLIPGGAAYLSKPFSPETLAQKVRETLDRSVQKKRVLVVDDEGIIREFFADLLTHAGYEVHTAAGAVEAVERCRGAACDLIMLDLNLGRDSGADTLAVLRAEAPSTRILIVSGEARRTQSPCDIADGFLPKPVSPEALVDAVHAMIGRPGA